MAAANTAALHPLTPLVGIASLAAATACTTRGPIAHASLPTTPCVAVLLATAGAYGTKIDKIGVKAISTSFTAASAAAEVLIWLSDGVTAYVIDEILVTAVTPNTTTTPSFNTFNTYDNLVLPPGSFLYASTSVTTTASTTALSVQAFGGSY